MSNHLVSRWLAQLGTLCASAMAISDVQAKLAIYAPMLSREFHPSIFNADCLAFVARRCKFFPTYGELCEHLGAYRREPGNAPPPLDVPRIEAVPRPDVEPPSAEQRESADAMVARLKALAREHDAAHARPNRPLPDVTLSRPILDALRQAAGIASPDPRIRASVALAHAVAPAMRAAAQRDREAAP